jgi:hypothetical protein
MLRTVSFVNACCVSAVLAGAASAQQVKVEALGRVAFNGFSSGPFAGVAVGQTASMTFVVNTPGSDLSPGQYTNYSIHKPTFVLRAGSVAVGLGAGSPALGLQNGFPSADGVHLFQSALGVPGHVFEFELFDGTGGQIFDSTDILQEAGSYSPALFQKIAWNINGGTLTFQLTSLILHPAVSAAAQPYGCGLNPAGSLVVTSGLPKLGATTSLALDNPLGTQASGSLAFLAVKAAAAPGFPCGVPVVGLGMAGGGAAGELLVDSSSAGPLLAGGVWAGAGNPVPFALTVPPDTSLYGVSLYAQGALVDPTPLADPFLGLSTGIRLRIGG